MKDQWWSKLAADIQSAADMNNSKELYSLTKQAYGPKVAKIVPLRSSNGNELLSTMEDISGRWQEHFNELLNRDSNVNLETLANIPQKPIVNEMAAKPTLEEVKSAIKKLNLGKAPGKDGLPAEIFVHGGDHLALIMHHLICDLWDQDRLPKDWCDPIMIAIFKGKGLREVCGNYRGIALLSAAGKILAGILLARLNKYITDRILPESQCGFRPNRGTMDMIFTARQLQENVRNNT